MKKIIIFYKFDNIHYVKRKQFDRKLFGSKEKTHKGRYTAITNGFLSNIKYEKPVRSVIILEKKYLAEILLIMKKYEAKTRVFEIEEVVY